MFEYSKVFFLKDDNLTYEDFEQGSSGLRSVYIENNNIAIVGKGKVRIYNLYEKKFKNTEVSIKQITLYDSEHREIQSNIEDSVLKMSDVKIGNKSSKNVMKILLFCRMKTVFQN